MLPALPYFHDGGVRHDSLANGAGFTGWVRAG